MAAGAPCIARELQVLWLAQSLTSLSTLCSILLTPTQKLDPFLPFDAAVDVWARTFAALGIRYRGATMALDLCDRHAGWLAGWLAG